LSEDKQQQEESTNIRAKKPEKELPLNKQLLLVADFYLSDLDCLRDMFDTVNPLLAKQDEERTQKLNLFLKAAKISSDDDSDESENEKKLTFAIGQGERMRRPIVPSRRCRLPFRS